ncbi:hypothetical protein MG293_001875 [Ovis ammon polii]|uniref:Uncharacterized protein n=1 Tax=Ovis ammon polii TaxID=230172 RepID=A0AAD4US45_OVIAM|nr:hypothetical protein MG293_001875 [Ovis ammon polii]KAI4580113.1 hypothetical protein MJT46_001481 [Ovis ammon polii x Ovis aries]
MPYGSHGAVRHRQALSKIRSEWSPGQVASLSLGFYSLKRDNGPPLVDGLHEVILSRGDRTEIRKTVGKGAKPAKDEADGAVETAVAEQKQLYIRGWGAAGCEQSPSNAQDSEVPVTEEGKENEALGPSPKARVKHTMGTDRASQIQS